MGPVAFAHCMRKLRETTGEGTNSTRKTKKSLLERVGVVVRTRNGESVSQIRGLSELTCSYRLRASIVSQTLIKVTRRPVGNNRHEVVSEVSRLEIGLLNKYFEINFKALLNSM